MAGKPLNGVLERIRALAAVHTSRACSDRDLIERFLNVEDEAAFTLLVERHGPMVLALCRRLLRDRHEADDACQATFLVLARKARSVRKHNSLASWLHGVAYRIAISLRRQHARRRRREQAACKPAAREGGDNDFSWPDFRAALDEELQRVPERCRAALILCYLEGKTRDEAAQMLGLKPGALHGLLNRGRKILRERLVQRGLTLSGLLFATALSESAVRASALAPSLVIASSRGALALLRGGPISEPVIASHILSLVKEASQTMFMTKVKIGAALVVAAGVLIGTVGGSLNSVSLAQGPTTTQPKPAVGAAQKTESDEDFIRRISKDLRGIDPSPAEVHFFLNSKDANRRQKVVDLFIQERQAAAKKKQPEAGYLLGDDSVNFQLVELWRVVPPRRLGTLQDELVKELSAAAKQKKDVAAITQKHLERLQEYVTAHPKNDDVADAMQQIALIYRSQGKTVEADAWRDKLLKEHPQSPAAKAVQRTSSAAPQLWTPYAANQGILWNPSTPSVTFQYPNFNQPYLGAGQWSGSTFEQHFNPFSNQPAPRSDEKERQK